MNETTAHTPIDRQPDDDVSDENAALATVRAALEAALATHAPFGEWLASYHENLTTWDTDDDEDAAPQPEDIVGHARELLTCPLSNFVMWRLLSDDLETSLLTLTGQGMRFRDVWIETGSATITVLRYQSALMSVGDDMATDVLIALDTPPWAKQFVCLVDSWNVVGADAGVTRQLARHWLVKAVESVMWASL